MELLKNIIYAILQGFYDSIKGIALVFYIDSQMNKMNEISEKYEGEVSGNYSSHSGSKKKKSQIMKQVFECCALNGGFAWLSIILFEYAIFPGLKYLLTLSYDEKSEELASIWNWLYSTLSFIFGTVWLLPIFLLSRIVSSLWFQDIANAAYKFRKGRPQLIPSISKLIADTLFSLLVQALFLVQSMLVSLIPINYLGAALYFLHLCLLYSLYSFEYKWFNMGWELHKRLNYIETNWPYFVGFGMPLTILTSLPNSYIVSGCVFSIAFPIFILSGNEAQPVIGICDFPLRLFSPVVTVANLFFSIVKRHNPPTSTTSNTRLLANNQRNINVLRSR